MQAVFVTGPQSSGKSSTAKALQRLLPDPWIHWEVDRTQPRVSVLADTHPDLFSADLEPRIDAANLRSARVWVDAGFRVIVEIGATQACGALRQQVFSGIEHAVIALVPTRAEVLRRVTQRGDRSVEAATAYFDALPWERIPADLAIDNTALSPDDSARRIIAWMIETG